MQYAKAHPSEVTYATIGAGSAQEILARQLEKLTGISMNRIPFRGGPQVVQELVAGRVHFYVSPTLGVVPQYQEKQLKILAVSAPERLKNLSGIPTLTEQRRRISCASAGSVSAPAPARRSRSSISSIASSWPSSARPNIAR